MNKVALIIVSLISVNVLFGSDTKDESSIRTIPIREVNGDKMPGWEKQIIERYTDEEGGAVPVIFRGAARNWEAAAWTPEYFSECFGEAEIGVVAPKLFEDAFDYDQGEEGEVILKVANTTMRDHINDITLNPHYAWYFIGSLPYNSTKERLDKNVENDAVIQNAIFMHTYLDLELQTRFPQRIAKTYRRSDDVFIGAGNTVASLHSHDSTFLAQMYGKKLATLVHPKYTKKCSCALEIEEEYKAGRCADIVEPDFEKYPELRAIEVYQTIVEAGDLLYIPKGWLHDIRGLGTSISISSF